MSEIGERQDSTKNQKICLYIIFGLYLLLLLICLSKMLKAFLLYRFWGLIRAKISYCIITTVLILRIMWAADIFFNYSDFTYDMLDVLPCATFTLLGTTFALFWIEMYINTSVQLSDTQKRAYNLAAFSGFIFVNFLNYSSHIFIVVMSYDDKGFLIFGRVWQNLVIVNVSFFIFTTICLAFAGKLLSTHVKDMFNGPTGEFVSKRITYVSIFCGMCFILKSILPLLLFSVSYSTGKYQEVDDVFILCYYGLIEIIPITLALILIQVTKPNYEEDEDDSLPEGLLPNYDNSLSPSSTCSSTQLQLKKRLLSVGDDSICQAFSERLTATFSSYYP
ncbi:unnamed protein product [Blepharisma stoltei]|uniref:THH1/TOM1/TOM3 domain-containing protein n=1 Tax=Blepharisma stoltei TaxID=1481888 RepID=A0AAU9IHU3_9CILI|nr:unnamed protein product [Blepharisma stoltei]